MPSWLQYDALRPMFGSEDVEVDEEAKAFLGELEVGEELGSEQGMNGVHQLELADDELPHQDIEPEGIFEGDAAVADVYHHLPRESEAAVGKLTAEADLVDVLQQAPAERSVHGVGGVADG